MLILRVCRLPESRHVRMATFRLLPQRSAASISIRIPLTCSLWSSRHDVLIARLATLRSSSLNSAKSLHRCSYSSLARLPTQRFLRGWCYLTRRFSCAAVVTHFVNRSRLVDATAVSQFVAVRCCLTLASKRSLSSPPPLAMSGA